MVGSCECGIEGPGGRRRRSIEYGEWHEGVAKRFITAVGCADGLAFLYA